MNQFIAQTLNEGSISDESTNNDNIPIDAKALQKQQQRKQQKNSAKTTKKSKNSKSKLKRKQSLVDEEVEVDENEDIDNPLFWSISEVNDYLKKSNCSMFASTLREHVSH